MSPQEPTQLSYSILTQPEILQVNTEANLTLVISNSKDQSIHVKSLTFKFPIGSNAKDFSTDLTGISTMAPSGWDFVSRGSHFIATPKTPNDRVVAATGLIFSFSGVKVNQQVGMASVTITEITFIKDAKSKRKHSMSTVIYVSKFPQQFFVNDLKLQPQIIDPGYSTTLAWNGSLGIYQLKYNGGTLDNLSNSGIHTVSNLTETTTFYLNVTAKGSDPSSCITVTKEATVTVNTLDAKICSFGIKGDIPPYLNPGAPLDLVWSTENADSAMITSSSGHCWYIPKDQIHQGQMTINTPMNNPSEVIYTLTISFSDRKQPISNSLPPIKIIAPLSITTDYVCIFVASDPPAINYSTTAILQATGGTPPYHWHSYSEGWVSGDGMSLSEDGKITYDINRLNHFYENRLTPRSCTILNGRMKLRVTDSSQEQLEITKTIDVISFITKIPFP